MRMKREMKGRKMEQWKSMLSNHHYQTLQICWRSVPFDFLILFHYKWNGSLKSRFIIKENKNINYFKSFHFKSTFEFPLRRREGYQIKNAAPDRNVVLTYKRKKNISYFK